MNESNELFVALAEIAGVFVGFGALIGFTRRDDVSDVDRMRIVGHADEQTSQEYTHTELEQARAAIAKIPGGVG